MRATLRGVEPGSPYCSEDGGQQCIVSSDLEGCDRGGLAATLFTHDATTTWTLLGTLAVHTQGYGYSPFHKFIYPSPVCTWYAEAPSTVLLNRKQHQPQADSGTWGERRPHSCLTSIHDGNLPYPRTGGAGTKWHDALDTFIQFCEGPLSLLPMASMAHKRRRTKANDRKLTVTGISNP